MQLHTPFVPTVRQRWVHGWILTFSAFFQFPHFLISHFSFLISSFLLLEWPVQHTCLKTVYWSVRISLISCQPCVGEEYEILSDLLESVVFHCQLCRGVEGEEAGRRVAVNEYMHMSFTEASFPYYCMHVVFVLDNGFRIHSLSSPIHKVQSDLRQTGSFVLGTFIDWCTSLYISELCNMCLPSLWLLLEEAWLNGQIWLAIINIVGWLIGDCRKC